MEISPSIAKTIAGLLLDIHAIKLSPKKPFIWASGWKSPIYCDNRMLLSYPEARDKVAIIISAFIKEKYPEVQLIAGVATGAIGIGMLVADRLDLPFVYVRPEPKKHGRQNQIEGNFTQGEKTVVIEDLISTGMSSLGAVKALRESQLNVLGMVAIFSYLFKIAKQNFTKENIPLDTLSQYDALLEEVKDRNYISVQEIDILTKWRLAPDKWD
ncbi:orotate phosphoribosyltransferase [Capnocytophaga sp. oral taxon 338]|uniref:orotate phosphoribosyltransferase n=1 Tax=Capnocytophaga sp. oral taxon 338 TaxID=710239 RepID=UPI000202E065|nr:orotate phosphoribosyltransferase [Capnocytophaga sp. oral taxon 338]EGD34143.1 orotate phosphoribosyltransferase [Capnocytophaga sp. oral taxon 338 str. F0234]